MSTLNSIHCRLSYFIRAEAVSASVTKPVRYSLSKTVLIADIFDFPRAIPMRSGMFKKVGKGIAIVLLFKLLETIFPCLSMNLQQQSPITSLCFKKSISWSVSKSRHKLFVLDKVPPIPTKAMSNFVQYDWICLNCCELIVLSNVCLFLETADAFMNKESPFVLWANSWTKEFMWFWLLVLLGPPTSGIIVTLFKERFFKWLTVSASACPHEIPIFWLLLTSLLINGVHF